MTNAFLFYRYSVLVLALSVCLSYGAFAQTPKRVIQPNIPHITMVEGVGLPEFQFFLNTGDDPLVRFEITDNGSAGTFSDLFCMAACPGSCPTRFCVENIAGVGYMRGTAPSSTANNYSITVTAIRTGGWDVDADGDTDEAPDPRNYDITVLGFSPIPCPSFQKFALVLDQSGSMGWPSGTPGQTRWDVLKNAVQTYLPTLNNMGGIANTDEVGVWFFNGPGAASAPGLPGTFDPGGASWITNSTGVGTQLFPVARVPGGGTPLGSGMKAAYDWLITGPADAMRNMIVFTDGVQNVDPWVVNAPEFDQIATLPTTTNLPTDANTQANRRFKIFTIGVGGADPIMMNQLANLDNEFAQADVPGYDLLNVFFTRTIPAAQRYCSPRILDYRYGEITDTATVSQVFTVNKFVRQLNIRLTAFPGIYLKRPQLWKDGVPTDFEPVQDGNSYRFVINFPINLTPTTFYEPAGKWEVRFRRDWGEVDLVAAPNTFSPGKNYAITAIVEDELLHHSLEIADGQDVYMGEKIPVAFKVDFGGKQIPLTAAAAWLVRPGEDLGDLAARTEVTNFPGNFEAGTDDGLKKIETLLQDSSFLKKIAENENFHMLTADAAGTYRTEFNGALVSGTYRVLVRYSGTIPGGGDFEGWELQSVLVKFAPPEEIDLQETVTPLTGNENPQVNTYQIVITPKNKYGKLLGPGHLRHIAVKTSTGDPVTNLTDQLDGSYSMRVSVAKGQALRLTINLLYEKKPVETIPIGGCGWNLSVNLGRTIPSGKMDSLYNPGISVEIGLGRRFGQGNRGIAELIGGYYHFDKSFAVLGATLRGGYQFPLNPQFDVFARAGAGIYKPDNLAVTPGLTAGFGSAYHITPRLDVALALDYFSLTKHDYQFFNLNIGAKYSF